MNYIEAFALFKSKVLTLNHQLENFNALAPREAEQELLKCCGSKRWAQRMALERPFEDIAEVVRHSDNIWTALSTGDWLEAFSHHPKIGEKRGAPAQSPEAARWSKQEQAATSTATQETLAQLASLNRAYEERFGYIFIVCATGKTTEEMLALIKERINNDPEAELSIAAEEQRKITNLRLKKFFE